MTPDLRITYARIVAKIIAIVWHSLQRYPVGLSLPGMAHRER